MKLLTFYSKSHSNIYENYFLDSYNKYLKDELELIPLKIEQLSKNGEFNTEGFEETMLHKIEHVISNIDMSDEYLIYSDCDVQFFDKIVDDLLYEIGDNEIAFQDDSTGLCAGFFICKQNNKVKEYFENVLRILKSFMRNGKLPQGISDQYIINKTNRFKDIKITSLPKDKYFSVSNANNRKRWTGEDFTIPKNIKLHHANWVWGTHEKINLMNYVRNNK